MEGSCSARSQLDTQDSSVGILTPMSASLCRVLYMHLGRASLVTNQGDCNLRGTVLFRS